MALSELDQNSRFEKSLGLLTTRFVNLLQEAEDGVLDLKVVSFFQVNYLVDECAIICEVKIKKIHFRLLIP